MTIAVLDAAGISKNLATGAGDGGATPYSSPAAVGIGGVADAAVTNPASSASILAATKGVLTAVNNIPAQGQALAAGSVPVVLTAAQVSTLAAPVIGTGANTIGNIGTVSTVTGVTTVSTVTAVTAITNALPAGTNSIGTVVVPAAPIPTITTSSTYAHTSVNTAYAFGQLWANNATPGSVTFGTVSPAKANNQAFTIVGGLLKKSGIVLTNAIFRVHLFNAAPTTAVGDYGTFTANLTLANWIGSMDCTVNVAGSDVSWGQLYNTIGSVNCNIPVSGAQTLFFAIEVRGAYTPVSAETLTLTLAIQ